MRYWGLRGLRGYWRVLRGRGVCNATQRALPTVPVLSGGIHAAKVCLYRAREIREKTVKVHTEMT